MEYGDGTGKKRRPHMTRTKSYVQNSALIIVIGFYEPYHDISSVFNSKTVSVARKLRWSSTPAVWWVWLERCRDGSYAVNVWVVCACITVCTVACFIGFWGSVFLVEVHPYMSCFCTFCVRTIRGPDGTRSRAHPSNVIPDAALTLLKSIVCQLG